MYTFLSHIGGQLMSKYLLKRNKTIYYRRRIPKEFVKYFQNREEIRFKVSQSGQFRGMMSIAVLNSTFEELIMSLSLETSDKKQIVVQKFMYPMKNYASTGSFIVGSGYPLVDNETRHQELNGELQSKIEALGILKKEELLNNLDVLDSLVNIIDPKKDFVNKNNSSALKVKKANITFKELYELFKKEKKQETGNDISQSTLRDYNSGYNDFIYVIPDAEHKDILEFIKDDFREFVDALHNHLPSSRTKKKLFKLLPYSELKELELNEDEKMASNTKKKKILTIKQIFDIAVDKRYAYLDENLAEAFLIKETKRDKATRLVRKPLSQDNLLKLFSSKIYTDKSVLKKEPEKYWLPILALYTGMRQGEICQLHVKDVKSTIINDETIYYFEINQNGDKHLKNDTSERLMPLHPKLIELGFIDYYNSIKDKQDRLWKNLRLHPVQKRYNSDYSKSFIKFFRAHITTEKDQVFHSLRHNVGGQLIRNTVRYKFPKALANQILGHRPDQDETTQTYSQGFGLEELYECIKTLKYMDIFNNL